MLLLKMVRAAALISGALGSRARRGRAPEAHKPPRCVFVPIVRPPQAPGVPLPRIPDSAEGVLVDFFKPVGEKYSYYYGAHARCPFSKDGTQYRTAKEMREMLFRNFVARPRKTGAKAKVPWLSQSWNVTTHDTEWIDVHPTMPPPLFGTPVHMIRDESERIFQGFYAFHKEYVKDDCCVAVASDLILKKVEKKLKNGAHPFSPVTKEIRSIIDNARDVWYETAFPHSEKEAYIKAFKSRFRGISLAAVYAGKFREDREAWICGKGAYDDPKFIRGRLQYLFQQYLNDTYRPRTSYDYTLVTLSGSGRDLDPEEQTAWELLELYFKEKGFSHEQLLVSCASGEPRGDDQWLAQYTLFEAALEKGKFAVENGIPNKDAAIPENILQRKAPPVA